MTIPRFLRRRCALQERVSKRDRLCSLLEAAGFERTINVAGGYDAWVGAGLRTE